MSGRALSRRVFLGRGAAALSGAVAAVALQANGASAAESTTPTFALTPNGGACAACRNHAANKVFRTNDAANTFRAHHGCHCSVVRGPSLTPPVFSAVFGDAGQSADRRDPRTAELLDRGTVDHGDWR
jgi:hypothetical protein